mgnify:CR=1 FL=1
MTPRSVKSMRLLWNWLLMTSRELHPAQTQVEKPCSSMAPTASHFSHAAAGAPLISKTLNISVSLDDFWGDYMHEGVCAPTNIRPRPM